MKRTLVKGTEFALNGANSIAIHVPANGNNPEVFLERSDGTGKNPPLTLGHVKVEHSQTGFAKISNIGHCDVQIEAPAPAIAPPKRKK
jgi:hypothetical protein